MTNFLNDLLFIFQRLDWLSVVDILLVTLIFFILLYTLRDTQALVLLRGVLFLVILLALLTSLVDLRIITGDPGHFCTRNPPRIGADWAGRYLHVAGW